MKNQFLFKKSQNMPFFQWPCDLAFFKIWLNTFGKIFLVLCTKLIFRCQKFVDELLISKGITLIYCLPGWWIRIARFRFIIGIDISWNSQIKMTVTIAVTSGWVIIGCTITIIFFLFVMVWTFMATTRFAVFMTLVFLFFVFLMILVMMFRWRRFFVVLGRSFGLWLHSLLLKEVRA